MVNRFILHLQVTPVVVGFTYTNEFSRRFFSHSQSRENVDGKNGEVPPLKAKGLTISPVPGDVWKSTGKPEKALVLDGHCRWESSVYETVKFLQDAKTRKGNHKISSGCQDGELITKSIILLCQLRCHILSCKVH